MSYTILHKYSSTPDDTPLYSEVLAREIAVNTYDGRFFTRREGGGFFDEVIEIPAIKSFNDGTETDMSIKNSFGPTVFQMPGDYSAIYVVGQDMMLSDGVGNTAIVTVTTSTYIKDTDVVFTPAIAFEPMISLTQFVLKNGLVIGSKDIYNITLGIPKIVGYDEDIGVKTIVQAGNLGWRVQNAPISGGGSYGNIGSGAFDASTPSSSSRGATGDYSASLGYSTRSLGTYSVAFGNTCQASGSYAFVCGQQTTADGDGSVAFGRSNDVNGTFSFAAGAYSKIDGIGSFHYGYHTSTKGFECDGSYAYSLFRVTTAVPSDRFQKANDSGIFGGINHENQSSATKSVILGGDSQNAVQPNMVYIMGHKYWSYTSAERIALTLLEAGTVVYDSDKKGLFVYDGTNWSTLDPNPLPTTVSTATHTLGAGEEILHVTRTATGTCAIDLATAETYAGRKVVIKDAAGGALTYNITITTEGAQTIDGAASFLLQSNYEAITLYCDGSNWFVI